jgi:hypothetical protein
MPGVWGQSPQGRRRSLRTGTMFKDGPVDPAGSIDDTAFTTVIVKEKAK